MQPKPKLSLITATCIALIAAAGCISTPGASGGSEATYSEEVTSGLEEIYVTRTVRTQYIAGATAGCAAAVSGSVSEQHYEEWSVAVSTANAKVEKTHEKAVGEFMACFSAPIAAGTFALYMRGRIDSVSYTAVGECKFMRATPPAGKLLVLSCYGDLSDLPARYVGGYLTTSSLAPAGGRSAEHVRGYLSTSVITMRFWLRPN